jgi:hypothetical protein
MRYPIRQFDGGIPMLTRDVHTGSASVAAEVLRESAEELGGWDDVMIRVRGECPPRGEAAKIWASVVLDS